MDCSDLILNSVPTVLAAGDWTFPMSSPLGIVTFFVLAALGTTVLGLLTRWVDRKVTARIQYRVGPPWFQPFADVLKLLGKETVIPSSAQKTLFLMAPVVGFAGTAVAAAMLWGVNLTGKGFMGDLIVVIYLLTMPSLAIILGGMSSGNSGAALGAGREMKLVFSYELPFILALATVVIKAGQTLPTGETLKLDGLILAQQQSGWMITHASGVIAFVVAVLCAQAKLGLVPFDMAEAEAEIMGGSYIEYSGAPLAVLYLMKSMLMAVLPLLFITVFWGGISPAPSKGWIWAGLAYVLVIVLFVLIRNTNPRLRIEQAVKFFWFMLTPLAAVGAVLAAMDL